MIKQVAIKWGLWKEKIEPWYPVGSLEKMQAFISDAGKHYCNPCNRWFADVRGAGAHRRIVHEGVFKKDRANEK